MAAGLLLVSRTVVAGDYYLRGGLGVDWPGNTAFTDVDCASTAPAALYGCGTGGDGAPYRSVGDFGTVPAIEFGLGYAAGPARFELLVEYRPHFAFNVDCRTSHQTECEFFQTEVSCCRIGTADYHFEPKATVGPESGGGADRSRARNMQVWWRRATRGARNHVAGRAFAKAIQAKPADAEGVLHVAPLIGEDVWSMRRFAGSWVRQQARGRLLIAIAITSALSGAGLATAIFTTVSFLFGSASVTYALIFHAPASDARPAPRMKPY